MNFRLAPALAQRQELKILPQLIQQMTILHLQVADLEHAAEAEPALERIEEQPEAAAARADEDPTPIEPRLDRALEIRELCESVQADADAFARLDESLAELPDEESHRGSSVISRAAATGDEIDPKSSALNNAEGRRSLTEHLLDQWALVDAAAAVRTAGETLIRLIDAAGYLRVDLEKVAAETGLAAKDLRTAMGLIQTLEPAGIGAGDLRQCLLLQIQAIQGNPDNDENLDLVFRLVNDHLEDLKHNRIPKIAKRLGCSVNAVKAALRRLARFDPHPGRQFAIDDARPIVPDAEIRLNPETGQFEIHMARDAGEEYRIRPEWRAMLKGRSIERAARCFISLQIARARELLANIVQRRNTLERVLRVVLEKQRDFFEKGPAHLKPLTRDEVGQILGIDPSAVSRAVSGKWIQTPFGVLPLDRWFSGGTTDASGQDMSWDAVKENLQVIIDNEDKTNPLNDDQIVEKLKEQGITLARRTVTKYRKLLGIPTAKNRKQFS